MIFICNLVAYVDGIQQFIDNYDENIENLPSPRVPEPVGRDGIGVAIWTFLHCDPVHFSRVEERPLLAKLATLRRIRGVWLRACVHVQAARGNTDIATIGGDQRMRRGRPDQLEA